MSSRSRGSPKDKNTTTPTKGGKTPRGKSPGTATKTPVRGGNRRVSINEKDVDSDEERDSKEEAEPRSSLEALAPPSPSPRNQPGDQPFDFDLNLPETPQTEAGAVGRGGRRGADGNGTGDRGARRKSFILRAQDGEYNKHVSFALLAFAFFGVVLGPFLYTSPPHGSGSGNGNGGGAAGAQGAFCDGPSFNVTRAVAFEQKLHSLTTDIENTVQSFLQEKKEAVAVISSQQALIARLATELESLHEKQQIVLDSTKLDRWEEGLDEQRIFVVPLPRGADAGTATADGSIGGHAGDPTGASASASASRSKITPGTPKDSVFDIIRYNLEELHHKINILTRAENTVTEFNIRASELFRRSGEIEEVLHVAGAKYTCPPPVVCSASASVSGDDITAAAGGSAGTEAAQMEVGLTGAATGTGNGTAADVDPGSSSATCPMCPACPDNSNTGTDTLKETDAGPTTTATTEREFVPTPTHGDFVNLDMARELVADLVQRTCISQLDTLKSENAQNLLILEGQMRELYYGDTKARALRETEDVVRLHNMRRDYASRRTGASIVLSETSRTYVPTEWDPFHRTHSYLDKIAQAGNLLSKPASILMDHPALHSVVDALSDFVGVDRGVGSPYDAISTDMSLGM